MHPDRTACSDHERMHFFFEEGSVEDVTIDENMRHANSIDVSIMTLHETGQMTHRSVNMNTPSLNHPLWFSDSYAQEYGLPALCYRLKRNPAYAIFGREVTGKSL